MLFGNWQLLMADPILFMRVVTVTITALTLAITVHEASHALIATWQGDRTARGLGRLTLNPIRHIDPAGAAMLLLVGFGWGKPVPINPFWLRLGPRLGGALVARAGPASNLLFVLLLSLPIRFGLMAWHAPLSYPPFAQMTLSWIIADVVGVVIFYNLILAVFNLIPLAPLDGFRVVAGLLPRELGARFAELEPYGPGLLLTLLFLSYLPFIQFNMWDMLGPAVRTLSLIVVGRAL